MNACLNYNNIHVCQEFIIKLREAIQCTCTSISSSINADSLHAEHLIIIIRTPIENQVPEAHNNNYIGQPKVSQVPLHYIVSAQSIPTTSVPVYETPHTYNVPRM